MIVTPPKPRACDASGPAPQRRSLACYVLAAQEDEGNRSPAVASDSHDSEVVRSSTARREVDMSAKSPARAEEPLVADAFLEARDGQMFDRTTLDESSIRCEQTKMTVGRGFSQVGINVNFAQRPHSAGHNVTGPKHAPSTLNTCGSPASSAPYQCMERGADEIGCSASETPRIQTLADEGTSPPPGFPISLESFAATQWPEGSDLKKRDVSRPASTYSCSTQSKEGCSRPTSGSIRHSTWTSQSCRDGVPEDRPRVDMLTVRHWFKEMDKKGDGYVAKQTFLSTLREVDWFRHFLAYKERKPPSAAKPTRMEFSLELRQGLRFWREMDFGGRNFICLDDFVEGFRRSGLLLEYENSDNPRTGIAKLMVNLDEQAISKTESEPMQNLRSLVKQHLCSDSMRHQSLRTSARGEFAEGLEMETVRSSLRAPRSLASSFMNSRVFADPGVLGE